MATPTPFTRAYDLPTIDLAAPHAPGDGRLVLAIGAGAAFGVLSAASPARVVVITAAGYGTDHEVATIFLATGRTGDVLTGVVAIEGTADRGYAAGDKLEVRPTAGYINDLNAAVNALEVAMAGGGGGGSTVTTVTIGGQSSTDHTSLGFANAALPPYSAVPDGVTPAAAAIQAAYDSRLDDRQGHVGFTAAGGAGAGQANAAAGTCWLPEGQYGLEAPLWPDGDLVAIKGSGRSTTILYAKPGIHPVILGPRRRSGWNRAVIDGFAFAGTLALSSGQAAVVGTGTLFTREMRVGTKFYLFSAGTSHTVQVAAIADDTHLTLTAPYSGASGSGVCVANTPYLATIPVIFAADHRVDAFGALDDSCAIGGSVMAPGMRWGVTTKSPSSGSIYPDHFLTWWATPPATGGNTVWGGAGDRYGSTRKLTISFYIEPPTPAGLPGGAIMGMGGESNPSPYCVTRQGNQFRCSFWTSADAVGGMTQPRYFYFGDARVTTKTRVTLAIDMTTTDWQSGANCSIRAWFSRKEVAIDRTQSNGVGTFGPSFKPSDNLTFRTNSIAPFNIGASTYTQVQFNDPARPDDRGDFTLYGLAISNDSLYESDTAGVGGNQRFKAGGPFAGAPLNDFSQFCGVDRASTLVACLYTGQSPTADYPGKLVWMDTGPAGQNTRVMGLFTYAMSECWAAAVGGLEISGLSVVGWGGMGACVSIGQCIGVKLDLTASGGWWGAGSFATSAGVYDIDVTGKYSGVDAGYYGSAQIVNLHDLERESFGHTILRFAGCEVHCEGLRASANAQPITDAAIWIGGNGGYSGIYRFKDIALDIEGSSPSAVFYVERSPGAFINVVEIDGITGPALPAGTPLVRLADPNPGVGPVGQFRLAHPYLAGNDGTVVQVDSRMWEGEVVDLPSTVGANFQPIKSADPSGLANIRATLYRDALPASGTYLKDSVEVVIRHPASGQPRRYRCTASGTVGSGQPPTWAAVETQP